MDLVSFESPEEYRHFALMLHRGKTIFINYYHIWWYEDKYHLASPPRVGKTSSSVTVFSLCYLLRFFLLCLRHLHFLKFSILFCRQYKLDLDVWEEVQLQEQGLWCCSAAADQHQRMVCRILIFHQGEIFHGCCDCFRNRDKVQWLDAPGSGLTETSESHRPISRADSHSGAGDFPQKNSQLGF